MPRLNRQISYTKVYHIILRGVNKQDIFFSKNDYYKFLDIIQDTKEKYKYDVYTYCLMPNHIHIIMYDIENKLSKIMQIIAIRYSMYFNKKYDRVGHLFQNRFLSKKIEDKEYLKMACRYIHQNPLKAGIGKVEDYKWSSYQEFVTKENIINTEMILSIFSQLNKEQAKTEFVKFHNAEANRKIYELMEYEMEDKITDEQLSEYICELFEISNVYEILQFNTKKRDALFCISFFIK